LEKKKTGESIKSRFKLASRHKGENGSSGGSGETFGSEEAEVRELFHCPTRKGDKKRELTFNEEERRVLSGKLGKQDRGGDWE